MAKNSSNKKNSKKTRKSKCPRAKDFTFCLGDCGSRFKCDLPNLDHKSQGRKHSFSKNFKKHEQELWFHVKEAERQLRRSHGDKELI
jgi:hypothetical protein